MFLFEFSIAQSPYHLSIVTFSFKIPLPLSLFISLTETNAVRGIFHNSLFASTYFLSFVCVSLIFDEAGWFGSKLSSKAILFIGV